ncbi:hypothetical protein CC2G_003806 [Coprinopsis cinerea AmutBmut pab1-1]|nr:hypothetical protein CC2G_003806 [Coprinopsis cinerea AmutBmut pab1-1]
MRYARDRQSLKRTLTMVSKIVRDVDASSMSPSPDDWNKLKALLYNADATPPRLPWLFIDPMHDID